MAYGTQACSPALVERSRQDRRDQRLPGGDRPRQDAGATARHRQASINAVDRRRATRARRARRSSASTISGAAPSRVVTTGRPAAERLHEAEAEGFRTSVGLAVDIGCRQQGSRRTARQGTARDSPRPARSTAPSNVRRDTRLFLPLGAADDPRLPSRTWHRAQCVDQKAMAFERFDPRRHDDDDPGRRSSQRRASRDAMTRLRRPPPARAENGSRRGRHSSGALAPAIV